MKWYINAFKNNYFNIKGRASRPEFWWFVGIHLIVGLISYVISDFVAFTYFLVSILPYFSVAVRRLHDTEKSAWWLLLTVIPIVSLVLPILLSLKGSPSSNEFGDPPSSTPLI